MNTNTTPSATRILDRMLADAHPYRTNRPSSWPGCRRRTAAVGRTARVARPHPLPSGTVSSGT